MSIPSSSILVDQSPRGVVTLTLNRAEKSNALDQETVAALVSWIEKLEADASARVLVLRGSGKHFCAGADITGTPGGWSSSGPTILDLCKLLNLCAKPTIAVVHGACIGGGLALAACCDVLVATPHAFFSIPEVRLGIAPGPLMLFFMQALPARALRRYAISGERLSAERAFALGLAHQVTAPDDLDTELAKIIDALLQGAPQAISDAKQILLEHSGQAVSDEILSAIDADFRRRSQSEEALEGLASFREKRRPRWYS